MASTTIDTDTELSAVNSILGAIGQSPVTTLGTVSVTDGITAYDNPEVSFIYNLLRDSNVDVQNEGWHFNTEYHVEYYPDSVTKKIDIGSDILKIDIHNGWQEKLYDVVIRNGVLYDKIDHTDDWSGVTSIDCDIVKLISFVDIPSVFKRYVIYRASRQAATQLVSNPELTRLLSTQEALSRASCLEYDCNQGNHTMLGLPENSVYTAYQPWRNLRR